MPNVRGESSGACIRRPRVFCSSVMGQRSVMVSRYRKQDTSAIGWPKGGKDLKACHRMVCKDYRCGGMILYVTGWPTGPKCKITHFYACFQYYDIILMPKLFQQKWFWTCGIFCTKMNNQHLAKRCSHIFTKRLVNPPNIISNKEKWNLSSNNYLVIITLRIW